MFNIESAALTHPGRKRANNQDYVTYFEPDNAHDLEVSGCVYILADGVGGASKGDRASQYAAQKVIYEYYQHPELEPAERLQKIMPRVGNEIYSYAESSSGFMRMATTMVVAVVKGNSLTVANVGDSRAYLIREGRAKQVTRDHSLVGEMVRNGTMTVDEARRSKVKNRITRSLGGERNVHVDIFNENIQPGDQILLCSDGLTRYANKTEIRQMVEMGTPDEVVPALIDFANRRGGADNISAIHIVVGEPIVVEEPTLVKARGETPTLVDWDDIETDAAILPRVELPAIVTTVDSRWIPLAAIAVVLVFGIGLGSILWFRSSTQLIETPSSQTPNTIDELIISTPMENTVADPAFPNVTSDKTPSPQVVSQTPILTITFTPSLTPSMTPTHTTSADDLPENTLADLRVSCEFKLERDKLEGVLDPNPLDDTIDVWLILMHLFNKEMSRDDFQLVYSQKIECLDCPYLYPADSPHVANYGWTMIFPDIDRDLCNKFGRVVKEEKIVR